MNLQKSLFFCRLKEELRLWKREYERIPKQDEIDAKKREIESQIEQTKKENTQRILELKNLKVRATYHAPMVAQMLDWYYQIESYIH